jgi:hypothetical protein
VNPLWNPVDHELFYVEPPATADDKPKMMSVDMTNPRLPGKPALRFEMPRELGYGFEPSNGNSISPDGKRLYTVMFSSKEPPPVTHVSVVLDWFEVMKRQLGTTR